MKQVCVVLVAVLLAGCATGFDRGALQQRLEGEELIVTDEAIREALQAKPQLKFPAKVAIHMVAETYHPGTLYPYWPRSGDWRWSLQDKESIETWTATLRDNGIVSDMFVMSEMVATSDDLKSIRLAAARHGADAVLLIKGVAQVDNYVNPLCILNLAILPVFFVPASHCDALFMMRGAMWDVGNEFLYLSVDAEGEANLIRPTALIKDKHAIGHAKERAMQSFGKELADFFVQGFDRLEINGLVDVVMQMDKECMHQRFFDGVHSLTSSNAEA